MDVELSTSNRCYSFHVDSLFMVDEISTNFRRGNSLLNHGDLTKMCPLGSCSKYLNMICIPSIFSFLEVNRLFHRFIVCLKRKTFCISLFFPSSYQRVFRNIGEFGAKQYVWDHLTVNTIQLFVAIKGNFSHPFFFWTSRNEGKFLETTW